MNSAPNPVLARVLERLPSAQRSGSGWMARCPAHEDRRPSLSISGGDDGRVLLKCYANCDVNAITAALGLELRDLFPPVAVAAGMDAAGVLSKIVPGRTAQLQLHWAADAEA